MAENINNYIQKLSPYQLSILLLLVQLTNTTVLSRMLIDQHIDNSQYTDLAFMELLHQQERWGEDKEQKFIFDTYVADIKLYNKIYSTL